MLLVESHSGDRAQVETALSENEHVVFHSLNSIVQGAIDPNDPEYANMTGLNNTGQFGATAGADVNAPQAWDITRGSANVVVGVIDSGVDSAHPDLFLNIWLNQGEIPRNFLDDVGNKLVDIDGDGLITFYDLNNATRDSASPFGLTIGGFASGPNAEFVRDLNENSYIDALDIINDPFWADGLDTEGNGFIDDFFG